MKRKSVYTCLVMLLMSLALQAKDKDVAVAEALLKRLLPSYIESFQFQKLYLQPIITQYFIDNKSEIWLLFLIAHSKR
ncbi:hypothetical protein DW985_23750 [Bacteroides ovatus]|nr:hypothetical protein DW985_23750 [Bacteroides ovatus]